MEDTTKSIYPSAANALEKQKEKLEHANIYNEDRDLLNRFFFSKIADGCTKTRIAKLMWQGRQLAVFIKQLKIPCFQNMTQQGMEMLIGFITTLSLKPVTIADYRRWIKQFYIWFRDHDERLDSDEKKVRKEAEALYLYLKKVKRTCIREQIDPKSIITDDDIEKVIDKGCNTHRLKALLSILHEGGFRIGEFLNIRIGDLQFKERHLVVHVDGKTGRRGVPLTKSGGYVRNYLDVHKDKSNPDAYLFTSCGWTNLGQPLGHQGVSRLIKRCFERAGCEKKCNCHWFRHSRASIMAPKLTEAMMCQYFGWTLGSKQVRTYAHISRKELETAVLNAHGIMHEEMKEDKLITCRCGTVNSSNKRYCNRCGSPLSIDVMLQDEEIKEMQVNKILQQFMEKVANDPAMMAKFNEFKLKTLQQNN